MLTDEEKVHLRSEEEYRREVQAEFARTRQKTAWQQFLDFFESSFGKWVLTSLLATGVTSSSSELLWRSRKLLSGCARL